MYLARELDILEVMDATGQPDIEEQKRAAWDVGLGFMKIDVEPTGEFLEEVEKEIRGEITPEDMMLSWKRRHTNEEV